MNEEETTEIKILRAKVKTYEHVIKECHNRCLCKRFETKGFDYHEKHPRVKVGSGQRPGTPRDLIENLCGYKWNKDHGKKITFDVFS